MKVCDEILSDIEANIHKLEICRALVQRLPPEMAHVFQACVCGTTETLILSMPNNRDAITETVNHLKEYGFIVAKEWAAQNTGYLNIDLSHPECAGWLKLYFRPDVTGATCKRQVVGCEKKPIYEITCL